jgi:hypothetical protein
LQVLPADIPQERLIGVMRTWGQALGVQCSYCHVPGNFVSDENPHKQVARGMVRMTNSINNELLPRWWGWPSRRGSLATAAIRDRRSRRRSRANQHPPPAAPAGPAPARPQRPDDAHIAPDTPARPY